MERKDSVLFRLSRRPDKRSGGEGTSHVVPGGGGVADQAPWVGRMEGGARQTGSQGATAGLGAEVQGDWPCALGQAPSQVLEAQLLTCSF